MYSLASAKKPPFRFAAPHAAVKNGPVNQRALVVHPHRVIRDGLFAVTGFDHLILQTAIGHLEAVFFRIIFEKFLPRLEVLAVRPRRILFVHLLLAFVESRRDLVLVKNRLSPGLHRIEGRHKLLNVDLDTPLAELAGDHESVAATNPLGKEFRIFRFFGNHRLAGKNTPARAKEKMSAHICNRRLGVDSTGPGQRVSRKGGR